MESYADILARQPFFKDLDPIYLRLIGDCGSDVCFTPGEFIFRQGGDANRFYLIQQGTVALELFTPERGILTVQTLGEGELLGASWLFPPYVWQYEARVIETTRAVAFNARCLRAACDDDHDLGYELMKRFAWALTLRLNATRLQFLDLYANPQRGG